MERAMLFLRVTEGRRWDILRAALGLDPVRHGAAGGPDELLLLAAVEGPGDLGRTAALLAALEGVESVACTPLVGEP